MKLLCTPNSLYSRIVRIVALELGVELAIEYVGVRSQAGSLLEFNPAGKVPTLLLDDGQVLAEARLICELLELHTRKRLLAAVDDTEGRALESIVSWFVDGDWRNSFPQLAT